MKKKIYGVLCLLLSILLLFGVLSPCMSAFAAGVGSADGGGRAVYTVSAHGGILREAGKSTSLGDRAEVGAGTVLEITLDETKWRGHTFTHWQSADGTLVPEKTFRTVADRLAAFYPVFSDLTGTFGAWEVFCRGTYCTDGTLYVRTDDASGLKEFRFERGYHKTYTYERLDADRHTARCADCPDATVLSHYFDAGVVTTAATHVADGVKTYTCTQCGEKKYEKIERESGHAYGDFEIVVEAKDGQAGIRRRVCACGDTVEGYYIRAEWQKLYRDHAVVMRKQDYRAGQNRDERHYNYKDEQGRDVYVYIWRRAAVNDEAVYTILYVDDHSGTPQPMYLDRSTAKYAGEYVTGHTWALLDYAKDGEDYLYKISHMALFGEVGLGRYASLTDDAFSRWESFYNQYNRTSETWYEDYGYTRSETTLLGYDCWKYRKAGENSYYDIYYIVTKDGNVCLEYYAGNERYGNAIRSVREMYYEDTPPEGLTEGVGEGSLYEWKSTHCMVKNIGTSEENLSDSVNAIFTSTPPEHPSGYRVYVNHQPIYSSAEQVYTHLGSFPYDYRHNFNIVITPSDIHAYDSDGGTGNRYAIEIQALDEGRPEYRFLRWEKYNRESGEWEFYSENRTEKLNYLVPKTTATGDVVKDEEGRVVYIEDHRLQDATFLRAVYEEVTFRVKVNGGYYETSTGYYQWSNDKKSEGEVAYNTLIRLYGDSDRIPEGKEIDRIVDTATGERPESYDIRITADAEYTVLYKTKEMYVEAGARNGVVKKDGETFSGGRFPLGTELTLTTESTDADAYPYFIGWCKVKYGAYGEEYTVISTETTYMTTIVDNYDENRITAVWSDAPELPKKQWHDIGIVRGFARADYDGVTVSALRVPDNTELLVVRDPTEKTKVREWVATDAELGTEIERKTASDYGTVFFIGAAASGGGKYDGKGKPGAGGTAYPAKVLITGNPVFCEEGTHDWDDGRVTSGATYESDGVKTYTCTVCGAERTEAIPRLERYCVHACKTCGKCTLPASDLSCRYERCSCTDAKPPILIGQEGAVSGDLRLVVEEFSDDRTEDTPYLNYIMAAADGYEVERIFDLSLENADGSEYTLPAGEDATVTLTVGKANAEAVRDGRLFLIHVSSAGPVTYGVGHRPITADTEAGTITFTTESFSPFLLVALPTEDYGRSALSALPNADALLFAYDRIAAGIREGRTEITVYNGTDAVTEEEIGTVFDAFRRDRTEYFELDNSYSMTKNERTVLTLSPTYRLSGDALREARAAFDLAVAGMLSGITSSMSEYEREKLLHDRLAAKVTYDAAGENAHDPYGALVEGRAVCEGYAEAFAYLLRKAGISAFVVTGASVDPVSGASIRHAWNLVRIDGRYYHVDPTWDDQGERIFYAYFNKSTAAIEEDHTVDATAYALPACTDDAADYFTVNGGRLPAFDLAAVCDRLRAGRGAARFYITGDTEAFIGAFRANLREITETLELSGEILAGCASLGREVILTVKKEGHDHAWDSAWAGDDTHHFHNCTEEGCDVTKDEDKDAYGAHTFVWKTDREASVTEAGEKHEECTVCGYKRAAVRTEKLPPSVTAGKDGTWTKGSDGSLTFRSDAAIADFIAVLVDGETLDAGQYEKSEGSILIRLKAEYLATLAEGAHTLTIRSSGGDATAPFRIAGTGEPEPPTPDGPCVREDFGTLGIWIAVAAGVLIAGAVICVFLLRRKKKS